MKRRICLFLSAILALSCLLTGCGGGDSGGGGSDSAGGSAGSADPNAYFKSIETFAYGSLDPHQFYYSWHSQKYGLSETLFRITDDVEIVPWLAEGMEAEENVYTITLKDGVCFSNGEPLTADMVKRNLERLIEVNSRFDYMKDWAMEAVDEKTLQITTPQVYPTMMNDLATPEACMIDLDNTTDFDNDPICTGPFMVEKFVPEGDITLKRNENYWDGEVQCAGVTFYSMSDEQGKVMAMQNGEVDAYDNLTASDIEIFSAEPDKYTMAQAPMKMLCFAYINSERIPDSVREAMMLVFDRDAIAEFLPGVVTTCYGAYSPDMPYGKAQQPQKNLDEAKKILEADGYTLNNGVWEKDGKPLAYSISTYESRNVDRVSMVMQEQLNQFGFKIDLKLVPDPDSTYMSTHDFDICMYRMITDKTGDPFPYIDGAVKSGSYQDIAGFGNPETDALIEQLRYEADPDARADLSNQIMEQFYDSNTCVFLVSYLRNAVLRKGVSGFSETNPYEFYGVSAATSLG